jgi:WD40 repeat protein/uncharacterized caspase-like protein
MLVLLAMVLVPHAAAAAAPSGLYEQPLLVVDPGMHTAPIVRADVDEAGTYAVTGALDKTVRVWALHPPHLVTTLRLPAGPGHLGKIYAVAMSPDGAHIAVGGWTRWTAQDPQQQLYLFTRDGALVTRIEGLPTRVQHLTFSRDGRYLAAGLGGAHGIRLYDRQADWREVARDEQYGGDVYGLAFAPDGRLATTSYDGYVRLYDRQGTLTKTYKTAQGTQPYSLAFNPVDGTLAVGFSEAPRVALLDGATLAPRPSPDVGGLDNGNVSKVAWSRDGQTLYAGGQYEDERGARPVVAWADGGRGARRWLTSGATDTLMSLLPLPGGALLVAATDPHLALLQADGTVGWAAPSPKVDARGQKRTLAVSADGLLVDFGYEAGGKAPARFDLRQLKLIPARPADALTAPPRQAGLAIDGWDNTYQPTLNGDALPLEQYERSRSLALHPDTRRFVLGADWSLRAYDGTGHRRWRREVPGTVWAVNITGDGRLVVAAYGDGTIRWHRLEDGVELLAFMPHLNKTDWVAWTPEGIYAATPGAHGVLQWHINRGWEAAEAIPVAAIPKLNRPTVLPLMIQEMDPVRALGIAEQADLREAVKLRTGARVAPGALLHIVSIGISDYGVQATRLKLAYAQKDARDVLEALMHTQTSLYAAIKPQYLPNGQANKAAIIDALGTMQQTLAASPQGRDLAVVMFSGHGALIEGRYYLLPHDTDARTPGRIKSSALSVADLRAELMALAERARVLVLLDACHAGAVSGDGTALGADAKALRTALAATNITVLTSSDGTEVSREDPAWQNGAFTKAVLKALGKEADTNHNGRIDVNELTAALGDELARLTGQKQTLGLEVRFRDDIFVARQ